MEIKTLKIILHVVVWLVICSVMLISVLKNVPVMGVLAGMAALVLLLIEIDKL